MKSGGGQLESFDILFSISIKQQCNTSMKAFGLVCYGTKLSALNYLS